jgi:hypothetical protein
MNKMNKKALQNNAASVEMKIISIRGMKVISDSDLAEIYGVETKILNKAVARNRKKFPPDFAFRLTPQEFEALRF